MSEPCRYLAIGLRARQQISSDAPATGAICDVPPELWALIAKASSRQALARLCAVSRIFNAVFSPLLYAMATNYPPLSGAQTTRLIEMLQATRTPYPALLVRRLAFLPNGICRRTNVQDCLAALGRLFDASDSGQPVRGSALRTLEWHIWGNMDALGPLLCTPGCFPNLIEINIQCSLSCTRFDFLRLPNLEKIEVSLTNVRAAEGQHVPSWDAYATLRAAINELRFPSLATLELSVDAANFTAPAPDADLTPFLSAHPCLTELILHGRMPIPAPSEVALFLPRLRAFKGSLRHSVAVVARARELAHLFLLLPDTCKDDTLLALFPPGLAPTVTRLDVRTVDEDGDFVKFPMQVSPRSLNYLVFAFPNLTHLDMSLRREMKEYTEGIMALPCIEYLCLRWATSVPEREWNRPAAAIFPAAKYAAHISVVLLPALPRLADVRLVFYGDRSYSMRGCSSCDKYGYSLPDLWVKYWFRVHRSEGEEELVFDDESR
ncbi:hypothetical protein B0H17DRAFT_1212189 [Mycena rosella]|uniref:F-box domain-containing protein n=1 Tax=Mycena rosella TaxID=1033263 RepID=A0AAD7CWH5_MYCRO|nr:hypothetical protein B0H17DRAFT_1212189 [Mycena rosella]